MRLLRYLSFLGLLTAFILIPFGVSRAQSFQIITSPLPIKLTLKPGQSTSINLRVKNQGITTEPISVGLMKFTASSDNGSPNISKLSPSDNYSWITFSPSLIQAKPDIWYTVVMNINVPKTASLGYYLAATFSSQTPTQDQKTSVANLNGVVATPVLINVVTPNEKQSMDLVSFSADQGFYEYLPANFSVLLKNTGNIYLSPIGNIFIYKGSKLVDTLYVNDAGGSILPGSERIFKVSWTDGFPVYKQALFNGVPKLDNHGKFIENLNWNFSNITKLRIGQYTAKLIMVYNNGSVDVPLASSLNFWVVPWKLILMGIAVLALIGYGIYSGIKSLSKKFKRIKGKFFSKK